MEFNLANIRAESGNKTNFQRKSTLISSAENSISGYLDPQLLTT